MDSLWVLFWCNFRLLHTTRKNKDLVQAEIQAQQSFLKEIKDVKRVFEQISTSFPNLAPEGHPERAEQFEVSRREEFV
jgi:nesprin-2